MNLIFGLKSIIKSKFCKGAQKDDYNLDSFISDFLLYYNDRLHSITKETPYKAMMNTRDKELIKKRMENTIKRD